MNMNTEAPCKDEKRTYREGGSARRGAHGGSAADPNQKISFVAGAALLSLTILLTIVYISSSDLFLSAVKAPPCDALGSYAGDAILEVCELGLLDTETAADGNEYFYPTASVTRAELARTLIHYLGENPTKYERLSLGFADEDAIPASMLAYVRAALAKGLMLLQNDYAFHAADDVTREEAAYIVGALCNAEISAGKEEHFSDFSEIHDFFLANAKKAINFDIMIGYSDGTFRPKQALTREELALILHRLLQAEDFRKG